MSTISMLSPLNLNEEKRKFFEDPTYNPQFTYTQTVEPQALRKWGEPQSTVVELAHKILRQRPNLLTHRMPVEPRVLRQKGEVLFRQIGITEHIEILFDPQKVTRCSVKGTQIIFRDPPEFESVQEIEATFNHEVQTHLLRNLNQKKQGWKLDRENHDHQILRTEEGLAVLHSTLALEEPLLWRPAAYYIAVWLGLQYGFSQMFAELKSLGFDDSFAWRLCIRIKRGLTDTSQSGGNTKDLCYLEGALQMWQWLTDPSHNPADLYIGKVYIEELEHKLKEVRTKHVYLPTFYSDLEAYKQQIATIGKQNFFEEKL
ncbi:DUF1704 domain-containing protein [Patescibacteria group bacterium]|nr:DUF1704 domain-containing protein [Patescibacteria group bacterium]